MVNAYVDGIYPKSLYDAITGLQGEENDSAPKEWLSQPRAMDDPTIEVIRYTFGMPASISALSFEVKRIGARVEVFYKNREGTVQPLLQSNRQVVAHNVVADEKHSWAIHNYETYPVIATELEFRVTRKPTALSPTNPASVGIRNVLIKRSITARRDASSPLPEMQDAIGNTVAQVVQDWGADNAFDNDSNTFWKSEPQPYPDGVVSLYVDTRDDEGNGQWIDHFHLDPVTSGQQLNVYYSNDDAVGANIVSESVLAPIGGSTQDVTHKRGTGLSVLSESGVSYNSQDIDFDHTKSHWLGFQWTPDYDSSPNGASHSSLFTYGDMSIYHMGEELSIIRGTKVFSVPMSLIAGTTYNIVAGFNMAGDSSEQGLYLAHTEDGSQDLVERDERGQVLVTLDSPDVAVLIEGGNSTDIDYRDYMTVENGVITPIPGKLGLEQKIGIISYADTPTLAGTDTKLSFYAQSDKRFASSAPPSVSAANNNTHGIGEAHVPRTTPEMVPNPLLDDNGSRLGTHLDVGAPFGKASAIGTEPVLFNPMSAFSAKAGDTFVATFIDKRVSGSGRVEPYIHTEPTDTAYGVSRHNTVETMGNGWVKHSCVINVYEDIDNATLGFVVQPTDTSDNTNDTMFYVSSMSVIRNEVATPHIKNSDNRVLVERQLPNDTDISGVALFYGGHYGSFTVSDVKVSSTPEDGSYTTTNQNMQLGSFEGHLTAFIVKQESLTTTAARSFLRAPETYILPDPGTSNDYRSPLSNALMVGRLRWEEVMRGGVDGSKYSAKKWIPVHSDWTVRRRWYYLPRAIKMKYLKLEFTNLVMEPYPVWEDGVKTTYQVFPLSVTEVSKKLATLDTTHTTTTKTVGTSIVETTTDNAHQTNSRWTHTNQLHDNAVSQLKSSSSTFSEVTLPKDYQIEVQKPVTRDFPGDSGITYEQEFHQEVANSAIYKGSTQQTSTEVTTSSSSWAERATMTKARQVAKTWTETKVVPKTKAVAKDVYYRVTRGDTLIGIAHKLGIPDWKVIYAYNLWLQSDPRVSMLPKRYPGWWIFPGQNFRIPNAVMEQITVYETVKVQRHGTETVYDEITQNFTYKRDTTTTTTTDVTTETEIEREETTKTLKNRFRSESVHRYDTRTVERVNSYAYFAAIRDVIVAKTNWLNERDVPMFDFADFESDGFIVHGVTRTEQGAHIPDGTVDFPAEIVSPELRTVSQFKSVKILGMHRNSIRRENPLDIHSLTTYLPESQSQDNSLAQAAWADEVKTWADDSAAWGSNSNRTFAELQTTITDNVAVVEGAQDADVSAVIVGEFSAKQGETVSGMIDLMPQVQDHGTIHLSIVDLDTAEVVSARQIAENNLDVEAFNTVSFEPAFIDIDRERLGLVVTFTDKASVSYQISNPINTTGTIRFLMKNSSDASYADVSDVVGRGDSVYTFPDYGRYLGFVIEMYDHNDWISGIQIIPLYNPDTSAV